MLRSKLAAASLTAALALTGLTACGGEQSVADACKVANTTVSKANDDVSSAMSEATTGDYSKLTANIKTITDAIREAEGKVTNTEVKTALSDMAASFTEFNAIFDGVKDGDVAALSDKSDQLTAVSEKITKSSTRITELCGS